MIYRGKAEAFLAIEELGPTELGCLLQELKGSLILLWFKDGNSSMEIDGSRYSFRKDEVIALTEYHMLKEVNISSARLIRFNRAFYCIYDHDSEVGCKGLLFFGARRVPRIQIEASSLETFETVYRMFQLEFDQNDHLQLEMLQMMLKRFLILTARLYKTQAGYEEINEDQNDLLREFNYLLEKHFKEKHSVKDYADLLYKSPKTLSNLFAKASEHSPLQLIQLRRMLEARRLLLRPSSQVQEVAYELGFEDVQSFSRFFKRIEGISPSAFVSQQGKN